MYTLSAGFWLEIHQIWLSTIDFLMSWDFSQWIWYITPIFDGLFISLWKIFFYHFQYISLVPFPSFIYLCVHVHMCTYVCMPIMVNTWTTCRSRFSLLSLGKTEVVRLGGKHLYLSGSLLLYLFSLEVILLSFWFSCQLYFLLHLLPRFLPYRFQGVFILLWLFCTFVIGLSIFKYRIILLFAVGRWFPSLSFI